MMWQLTTISSSAKDTGMGEYGENPVSVLFVCMGNICRSPLAEGVFRHLAIERGLDVLAD